MRASGPCRGEAVLGMDSVGQRLERLARLRTSGDLSDAEHELLKERLIAGDEGAHLEYKCQVWVQNVGSHEHSLENVETSLERMLNAGVAKGWKLFSVAAASSGASDRFGGHYMITLIWEVPPPKPMTPQEVERERRREVERERKRGGRTTAG